jgi:hypothetical protein
LRAAALAASLAPLLGVAAYAQSSGLTVELNKLETKDSGCRAYIVVNNQTLVQYQDLKIDLILFQTDGVIGRRFAINLAPLKPSKRSVKLFDLATTPCDQIGSFLINDVVECKADGAPRDDCHSAITVKSLTNVELTK